MQDTKFSMNQLIKYPGSKWSLAKWIINKFPPHRSYLEPFFGSGAVFFNKSPSDIETINDLDGDIVNLFYCIREHPEELVDRISFIPYSRQVYDEAFEALPKTTDPIERAVLTCVKMNMGHGFKTNGYKNGWKNDVQGRQKAYAVRGWLGLPEQILLACKRLQMAQIENMDAIDLIRRVNSERVLVYCDPPYVMQTKHGAQYKCEMDDAKHEELLDVLKKHRGPALISGYDSDMYNTYLKSWHREEKNARDQKGRERREILWMNYEPLQMSIERMV